MYGVTLLYILLPCITGSASMHDLWYEDVISKMTYLFQ